MNRISLKLFFCVITFAFCCNAFGQNSVKALKKSIQYIIDTSGAKVGLATTPLDFKTASVSINQAQRFPMQSVYKFPQAMVVLDLVDKKKLSLSQKIHVDKGWLDTNTWGPLYKQYGNNGFDISLEDVLIYAVSKSDNNACDLLFKLAGGTKAAHQYFVRKGLKGMNIRFTEAEMKLKWENQYRNYCEPQAMQTVLKWFFEGRLLSLSSNALLMKWMTETENSPNRLKGQLPKDATVAHKTGTSNTQDGITAATNDVGIVTLPNGKHYAITVFVSDYKGGVPKGERIISTISKLIWDFYQQQ